MRKKLDVNKRQVAQIQKINLRGVKRLGIDEIADFMYYIVSLTGNNDN